MQTEILQHQIKYWFRDNPEKELSECSVMFIESMIKEGYSSGEICEYDGDKDYRGWWEIVK